MIFRQIIHEDKSCLSYMVGCSTKSTVAIIDPREDISQYETIAKNNGLSIDKIIDTHSHADHKSGARELAERNNAELMMAKGTPVIGVTNYVTDGDIINVGNRTIKVIATPGHTNDSISLYVDDWYVLTADSLFVGDVGRVDLALEELSQAQLNDNANSLYDSIQKLLRLPDTTEIYPGHFAGSSCGKGMSAKMISTIGREKLKNEALSLNQQDFTKYVTTETSVPPEDYAAIKKSNIGQS
jgi:glyoxylase-like metal-dependent hydrolase (beta-lactamase superfamily II)